VLTKKKLTSEHHDHPVTIAISQPNQTKKHKNLFTRPFENDIFFSSTTFSTKWNKTTMQRGRTRNDVVLPSNKTITVLVALLMPPRTRHQFRHNSDSPNQFPNNSFAIAMRTHRSFSDRARTRSRSIHQASFMPLLVLQILGFGFSERDR